MEGEVGGHGRRHLLGWLSALCGVGERPLEDNATYQAAWQAGFDAGRAFQSDHPHWWPRSADGDEEVDHAG